MRSTMAALPLVVPGMLLWAVMAIWASPRVARILRISRWHAVFLLLALGLVLMATLPPTGALLAGRGSPVDHCDLSRMGIAPWSVLLRPNETSLNVLLFVPLGLALGALPGSPRAAVLIVGAFLLPVAIELFQLAVPALGRGCQSADVIDNTMGLVIGLALGFAGHRLLGRRGPT
jgi:hypothetical protein